MVGFDKQLEHVGRRILWPPVARFVKRVMVYPRYAIQSRVCRKGFEEFGHQYPDKVLFVAGLPKSGTTWLKKMLTDYPGFGELLIPDVAAYELETGGSHDYELPDDMMLRFEDMLVVTKMHVHGSPHNVRVLQDGGVRYVVIYRDLRDVAVSHYFYVRQTPWHPEYPIYSKLTLEQGLTIFAERTLVAFADWVRSWHKNRDPAMSLELTYERMLEDPIGVMTRVAEHFDLDSSLQMVEQIVAANSFQNLSGGRKPGQDNTESFLRKGVAGDWKNHFTPELREVYKRSIGDFLIEFGYERDKTW